MQIAKISSTKLTHFDLSNHENLFCENMYPQSVSRDACDRTHTHPHGSTMSHMQIITHANHK